MVFNRVQVGKSLEIRIHTLTEDDMRKDDVGATRLDVCNHSQSDLKLVTHKRAHRPDHVFSVTSRFISPTETEVVHVNVGSAAVTSDLHSP